MATYWLSSAIRRELPTDALANGALFDADERVGAGRKRGETISVFPLCLSPIPGRSMISVYRRSVVAPRVGVKDRKKSIDM